MNKNKLKFSFVMIFLATASQVFAEETKACREANSSALEKLDKSISEIDWWSATEKMVDARKCKEAVPLLSDIEKEIESTSNSKTKISTTGKNVNFTDESPELIEAFNKLTVQKDYFGRDKPSEDVQAKYLINPECKKVKCAVEKIFGKELGNKLLYINLKSGFNGSELAFDASSRLNIEEVDSLMSAIASYPKSRFPLSSNKQLTKFKRGYTLASHGEGVVAYSAIAFYDAWTNQSKVMKEYTAYHEMGHYVAQELNLDDNKAWLDLSGWVQKDKAWIAETPDAVTSKYGATNPAEDFAESVTAYRYNPLLLKKLNPDKYQFLKETVFDGLEYIEEAQCKNNQSTILKLAKDFPESSTVRTADQVQSLIASCGQETRKYLLDAKASRDQLISCLNETNKINQMINNVEKLRPPLKNAELVKEGLRHMHADIPPSAPPDEFKDAEALIRNQLIDGIFEWEKARAFSYRNSDPATLCKSNWQNYGYQAVFSTNENLEKAVSPFSVREELDDRLTKLCEKIHKGKTTIQPFTRAEIDKALGSDLLNDN